MTHSKEQFLWFALKEGPWSKGFHVIFIHETSRRFYEDHENIKCDLRTIIVTPSKAAAPTNWPKAFIAALRLIFVDIVRLGK